MAWRIHRWSAPEGRGEVVSPHFGPWPFGHDENPRGIDDFSVYRGVSAWIGWDEDAPDFDPSMPLFRLASPAEIAAHALAIPSGSTAYAIVTRHGQGPEDGPVMFVVAESVAVER